ncbi:MAG: DNA topoisomerase (ATP-hydrolyzing) subunit B [Chloroflexi bacterium]|nr:DNA topoisomerase (ATP-hydrolyzing) subunit B [Chloroflexota bacterium]
MSDESIINSSNNYDAGQIQVLEGLDAVRKRPGMYVGGTDSKAMHHLVYEVVDNSVDEVLAGVCSRIEITIHADESVTVRDNGRGIPTAIHPTFRNKAGDKISTLEVVMTNLHAGGKFGSGAYTVSGGLHGVGVKAVNALSTSLIAEVRREGQIFRQSYKEGKPTSKVEVIGTTRPEDTGTQITFLRDTSIFVEDNSFKWETLVQRFREMAFITRGVTIKFKDEREEGEGNIPGGREMTFYFEDGISAFVLYLNRNKEKLHSVISAEKKVGNIGVEFAMQYTEATAQSEYYFANTINTPDGGTHQSGFRSAVTRSLNDYARKANILKEKDSNLDSKDTLEGLTAIVSIKHPEPQFESQTKVKLMNTDAKAAVEQVVRESLMQFLEENPREGKQIIDKCLLSQRAREAAKAASELVRRKSALESGTLPGKLADCSERDPAKCEIFIVEGDSAGGCFDGDTLVALADGRNLSFKNIVAEQAAGQTHFCYTIRKNGKVGLERIVNARVTKQGAQVIKLTLDNGEEIICTPDHRFMLRNGEYKAAENLTTQDSLMPLRRKESSKKEKGVTIDGYEMVWDPRSETWLFTHVLADWYNRWQHVYAELDGDHCHHIDFNKRNNNPTNIQRLPKTDHLALHRAHVSKTLHQPNVFAKLRQLKNTPAFRKAQSERMKQPETRQILSSNAKAQWQDENYKTHMGEKWQAFYNSNETYRKQNQQQLDQAQRHYWGIVENRNKQAARTQSFFAAHPTLKKDWSEKAKLQWQDDVLLAWRREQTSKQWTPEFRAQRQQTLHNTYYQKTVAALKQFEHQGAIDLAAYDAMRCQTKDKSMLRFDTFCARYFAGDTQRAKETVENYNHKIIKIEHLSELRDVYDIEVPGTHNFALASGVFVHNSAKQGRDRHFQAILPLFGKIMNTERARLDKILQSDAIKALVSAVGTGIGEGFNIENRRYDRIVLMADADVDGSHIRTLLLTFFFRYMQPLVERGHLYIAQPPLYRIEAKRSKDVRYAYSDIERDGVMNEMKKKGLDTTNTAQVVVQRFKGLGEMNAEQLWDTTMDPTKRTMLKVTVEDAAEADRTFDMLMGNAVPPRRAFITRHAKEVKNLDV